MTTAWKDTYLTLLIRHSTFWVIFFLQRSDVTQDATENISVFISLCGQEYDDLRI